MASGKKVAFPAPTARFKLVVQRCGRPAVHLTLVAPPRDRALRRLDGQRRVMTVFQAGRGHGADYGQVGIFKGPAGQLLVFPKSLRRFAEKRIVGIDYSLLTGGAETTEAPAAAAVWQMPVKRRTRPAPPAAPAEPAPAVRAPKTPAAPPPPPEPEPASMAEVLEGLEAIRRRLQAGRYPAAKAAAGELIQRVRRSVAEAG